MKRLRSGIAMLGLVAGLVMVFAPTAVATEGNCQTFSNHSGRVPGSYDYAEFYEDGQLVAVVETNGEDIFVNPAGFDAGSKWDQVRKCHTTDLIDQPVQIAGDCIIDQAGVARATYSAEGRPGAVFTVNGVDIGGAVAGGTGVFGVNTWSVVALEGYVIEGPTEGSFVIEDCTPTTTTTTTPEATTTTVPVTTTTGPTVTTVPDTTTVTTIADTPQLRQLPVTGPVHVAVGVVVALALIGTGLYAVLGPKDDE